MYDSMVFNQVKRSEKKKIAEIIEFLHLNDLEMDTSVEIFITISHDEQLLACGGIAGNIIKCVAISEAARGQGLALRLATELVNLAYERHHSHLFIYTKSQNEALFRQCGFFAIASVPGVVVLMENSANRLQRYCKQLAELRQPGKKIGSIVMNANPFTLGHQYLICQAAANCDWLHLFLVKEDSSLFSYHDRMKLVQENTQGIVNLTLHSGSEYLISRATFPSYFIKDLGLLDSSHTEIDLKIFRQYLAPALGITHRFVGTEPYCIVTANYNQAMRHWLATPELPDPPIKLVEIERLEYQGQAVSASWVRRLLKENDMQTIAHLVPKSTLRYLQQIANVR